VIKEIEVERKQKLLRDTESKLKRYELAIKKKEKDLSRKKREYTIQSAGCQRMLAEGIAKSIIDNLIWDILFKSLTQDSFSLSSRKQACISAFTKMKSSVNKLESLKQHLEKSALLLLTHRHSTPIP
jgi:CYTH domain-containing protein